MIAIPNPDYDPFKIKTKGNREFFLFATSINFGSVEKFIKRVPEEYRKRWNIETGYRVKNEFKIRTCSRSYVVRTLFFVIQCIFHNFLNVLKRVLCITACMLKSVISEDISDYLANDRVFYHNIPLRVFYSEMVRYIVDRDLKLVKRLRIR